MSREIKFRSFVEHTDSTGGPNNYSYMNHHIEFTGGLINDIFATSGKEPLNSLHNKITYMQYTGLKDAKEKEIYEGDIVEFKSMSKTERHYVEYSDYGEWCVGMYRLPMKFQSCEVIGNIYEHSHLLEESQNESK